MTASSPHPRSPIWAACTALALSLLTPAIAGAAKPVLLWGFQRGCEPMGDLDRQVEKELYKQNGDVGWLRSPKGKPLPACSGERCAQLLRSACPGAQGRILGGQVVNTPSLVKTRLWLYDLGTGQSAYQDEYCQSCDLLSALRSHARRLISQPHFGAAAGPKPSYCSAAASPPERDGADLTRGPTFLIVLGDGKHKSIVFDTVKQQLGLLGRQVIAAPAETYARDDLQKIVAGQKNAQVLGVKVSKDGQVELNLFDQKSELTNAKTIKCPDCAQDKEVLIAKVQPAVAAVLDYCFADACASPGERGADVHAPEEACEAFEDLACAGQEMGLTSSTNAVESLTGPHMDAKTAKIIKGLTWGTFSVSAATAITLFALSGTSAGTYQSPSGLPVPHNLDGPALAALGITGVLLGVAIPTTIVVNRAVSHGSPQRAVGSSPSPIQCPN